MSDLDPFNGVQFPQPMQPLRTSIVQPQQMPAASTPAPQQEGGGLIDFFKSLFHRQSDLDDIINQNGLRGPAQPYAPSTGGVRG